jgi:hypothetical protein
LQEKQIWTKSAETNGWMDGWMDQSINPCIKRQTENVRFEGGINHSMPENSDGQRMLCIHDEKNNQARKHHNRHRS